VTMSVVVGVGSSVPHRPVIKLAAAEFLRDG
jgi:hypothetical protein